VLLGELHQLESSVGTAGPAGRFTPKLSIDPPRSLAGDEHTAAKTDRTVVWPYLLFAFAAGRPHCRCQFGINAQLAHWLDSPCALLRVVPDRHDHPAAAAALVFKPLPPLSRIGHAPWWVWLGRALSARSTWPARSWPHQARRRALIAVIVAASRSRRSSSITSLGRLRAEARQRGRLAGLALVGAGVVLVRIF